MASWMVWKCDGCDAEQKIRGEHRDSWKRITVTLSGFSGYPVGDHVNGQHHYKLCPACQQRLADAAKPVKWPRAATENAQ